ncbi:hypothetical protein SprV_0200709300 [Sparganum proliferum]
MEFERGLLNRDAENSKLFYGYIRQCTRNNDPIPLLMTAEGKHLTEDGTKGDHLSEFFRSVLSSETGFNPSALQPFDDTTIMETVQFTEGLRMCVTAARAAVVGAVEEEEEEEEEEEDGSGGSEEHSELVGGGEDEEEAGGVTTVGAIREA